MPSDAKALSEEERRDVSERKPGEWPALLEMNKRLLDVIDLRVAERDAAILCAKNAEAARDWQRGNTRLLEEDNAKLRAELAGRVTAIPVQFMDDGTWLVVPNGLIHLEAMLVGRGLVAKAFHEWIAAARRAGGGA